MALSTLPAVFPGFSHFVMMETVSLGWEHSGDTPTNCLSLSSNPDRRTASCTRYFLGVWGNTYPTGLAAAEK